MSGSGGESAKHVPSHLGLVEGLNLRNSTIDSDRKSTKGSHVSFADP